MSTAPNEYRTQRERLEAGLAGASLPRYEAERGRRIVRFSIWWRTLRGKRQCAAGYQYARLCSHHLSGIVNERMLGYGDSMASAVDDAIRKHGREGGGK